MKIVHGLPPNHEALRQRFAVSDRTVFTYGDTIYVPNGTRELPWHLLAHEDTHRQQQGDDPAGWWERFLVDVEWRYAQELAAYQAQYRAFAKREKSKNARALFAQDRATDLTGPLYGNCAAYDDALAQIRRAA